VRFRYSGDGYDWYAQVDDIALTCAAATPPIIGVDPASLAAEQGPNVQSTQQLDIGNSGGSLLSWNIVEDDSACDSPADIPWLAVVPDAGTTPPLDSSIVDVTFDSTGLMPGDYTANLCVNSDDPVTPVVQVPVALTVYTPLQANFSGSPTRGLAPLTVDFTNQSTGDYETSLWKFGDGVTSTLESPTHTYVAGGIYTVTLSIDGPGRTDTEVKPAYVTVEPFEQYRLQVSTVGRGTVTKQPDQDVYHYGDVVTLTASADLGWTFAGWTGDVESTENPLVIVVENDVFITAGFNTRVYLPLALRNQ
jgi:PKD repeat protein